MNAGARLEAIRGQPGECWPWPVVSKKLGYGTAYWNGRLGYAHRFAYEVLVGPIPEGATLDHLCRNKACVNPSHLEPVSRGENVLRGVGFAAVNKAKACCPEGHPLAGRNLIRHGPGGRWRRCRTCARRKERERHARKRRG